MKNKELVVVHFDEIAIKGKNRRDFERALERNLNDALKRLGVNARAKLTWGRVLIEGDFQDKKEIICESLKIFPGVSNFGFALQSEKSKERILSLAPYFVRELCSYGFRVSCKRSDKSFPQTSQEVEREFGAELIKHEPSLKVRLKGFEKELRIEILHNEVFAYVNQKGIGGLPLGSSGSAVALLSAGFDSPVASFLMMKRGVRIFPIHFHAREKVGPEPLQAVKDTVEHLAKIQGKMALASVDVLDIQKYIANNAPEKLRIVLLRRVFNRLASRYANDVGALALVTGESVGQVASQTLENILTTTQSAKLPILRPLIGMNKSEIIELARKIGTHDISARPCDDTCSLFLPEYPETKSKLDFVLKVESELHELANLEEQAYDKKDIF